jgi:CheY-like chemotaxis protein
MASVLVVDDDLACRVLAALLLEHAGHSPTAVASVGRALERLDEATYDLVLTDLNMPGSSGLDLLLAFRERRIETPTVVMTGSDDDELLARVLDVGAVSILRKPYGIDALGSTIAAALGPGPRRQHAA